MTENSIPIETKYGFLEGRDAIYLDKIESDGENWAFSGELNGHLVTKNPAKEDWISYKLQFMYVQNIFSCDIECMPKDIITWKRDGSSFDQIKNPRLLKDIPIRDDMYKRSELKQFFLQTYDVAFIVIAMEYEMEFNN